MSDEERKKAEAAKLQAEKDRFHRIYVLQKEREFFVTVFNNLELTISGWIPSSVSMLMPPAVPIEDDLNLIERELEQVLTEQRNKSRSLFLQCHGAEYANDYKDEFETIFKSIVSVQGLRRKHFPSPGTPST